MAEIPHWNHPDTPTGTWDDVVLGGLRMPGVCKVDISFPSGIDFQKPRGKKGAKLKDIGDEPAKLTITVQLTERTELLLLPDVIKRLRPRGASLHDPLEIQHPWPNAWGITTVVVEDIDAPQPDAIDGMIITINALEWLPQPEETVAQKTKPQGTADADAQAWAPFVDDDVAGTGVPSKNDSAQRNLDL